MNKLKKLGQIGSAAIRLDLTNAEQPVLMLDDSAEAQRLAALISADPGQPFEIDWLDADHPEATILRVPYTPAADRRLADLLNALLAVYYAIPDQVRNDDGVRA